MHPLLARQLKKFFNTEDISAWPQQWKNFLDSVAKTYQHYDEDYKLIERSLDISSKELTQSNQNLREEVKNAKQKAEELTRINNLMVGRELKMIELKKKVNELERKDQPIT